MRHPAVRLRIGQLQMELICLQELARLEVEERRVMIEAMHPGLSVTRQCELLELPRSTYYHRAEPESDGNLALMRVIDETYLAYPFFGRRQITRWLCR